jgi:DNA repair protein RecO (recombination protein O)
MEERATGIVLRTRPLTESSLIVNWLTPEVGRIATVGKGARRPKSPLRGKIDLFYTAEFTFARSRRSDLHNLREVNLLKTCDALRRDLAYLNQAAYCARLIEQTTESETPLPEIYELFTSFLDALPKRPASPITVLAFEVKMLAELGLGPQEGKTVALTERLTSLEWKTIGELTLAESELRELRQFLHGFLVYHLGRIPPNRAAALNG